MEQEFEIIKETVLGSTTGIFAEMAEFWPNILGALLILLIGLLLGIFLEKVIVKFSNKIKIPFLSDKLGLDKLLKKAQIKTHISVIIAKFLKGYIIFMFLMAAANVLKMHQVAEFLNTIIAYIPNVLIALMILLIGIRFGETTSAIIETTLYVAKSKTAKVIASVSKYTLIFFAVMAALAQLEIANEIVMTLFIGFVSTLALAGGLAFGLGGKDLVRELLEDLKKAKK